MANADRPQGLRPEGELKRSTEYEAGSEVFPGDLVAMAADGQVDAAAAGGAALGVALTYASAAGEKVFVSDDPEQRYTVQADEADIADQASVGQNADIVAAAGDGTYKVSRQELDSSTAAAADGQLRILAKAKGENNDFGGQVELVVKINENQLNQEAGI